MKKLLFILTILCISAPAFAQLKAGQQMFDIRGALGFQLQNSGINYSPYNERADWGTLGAELGLAYYYFLSDSFGVGADFSYGDFDGANLTYSSADKINDYARLYNLMLTARYALNPQSRARIYFPFGFGLSAARQDIDISKSGIKFNNKKTEIVPALFIGAGLEFDVGQNGWSWGLETRYNAFWYDTDKLIKGAPPAITADGKRRYEYLTFQLRIAKRF